MLGLEGSISEILTCLMLADNGALGQEVQDDCTTTVYT